LSNLDAKLRIDMRTEIKKLHHQIGKTTIYVTHDQVEAMTLSSRIAVMHKGELQQFDEPQSIYDRPANLFVAGFMGSPSMNFLPATIVTKGGKSAAVIKNGDDIAIPLARAPKSAVLNVILGVRPEHIRRVKATEKLEEGLARIVARVEVVEPTGSDTHAILRLGSHEITARFVPSHAPKMGDVVTLSIDMRQACLFDAATQRIIN
jgi:multiple sugar transport system ATP-binding protein